MEDVYWWIKFVSQWNGVAFFLDPTWTPPPIPIQAIHRCFWHCVDMVPAGMGDGWAKSGPHSWPQSQLCGKKNYVVVIACKTQGDHVWSRKCLLFHCDNKAIVTHLTYVEVSHIVQTSCTWYEPSFRCSSSQYNFKYLSSTSHAGINKSIGFADSHSRLQLQRLWALAPDADLHTSPHPCRIDLQLTAHLHQLQGEGVTPSTRRTYKLAS